MLVRLFAAGDLPQLQQLVNRHLNVVVPGWALSEKALARHLHRDDTEPITDPWVVERATMCAVDGDRLLAAAHVKRYGDRSEVSESYRGAGEIAWFVAQPNQPAAAAAVIGSSEDHLMGRGVREVYGWGAGLPAGPLWGVPEVWPHIMDALQAAGYRPDPTTHGEALYGGWIPDLPLPSEPPVPALSLQRRIGPYETRFAAVADDQDVGHCDVSPYLTGGLSPAFTGWAWLTDLAVREEWRDQGIGRWLMQHALSWLRLAGCDRIVLSVDDASERAGAGRFYRRFGWDVFTWEIHGWRKEHSQELA